MDFKSFVKSSALGILLKSPEKPTAENVSNGTEAVVSRPSVPSSNISESRHGVTTNFIPIAPKTSQVPSQTPSTSHTLLASLLSSTPCAPTPAPLSFNQTSPAPPSYNQALEQISVSRHPHVINPPTQAVLPQVRVAPTTPPIVPNTGSNPQQPPITPGHPRLEKARLLSLFAVTLSTANLDSMKYVAVVMDKGTLLVPHDEASPLLNGNLELGKRYNIKLARQDPGRVSFDRVELNLGVKKYCVEKPGSAAKVVNQLSEKPSFYLQTTAVVRVDRFLVRERQRRWVLDAKLLGDGFWAGGVQDWSKQSPEVWKEQCELVAHSDLKCFLQRCNNFTSSAASSSSRHITSVPTTQSVPLPSITSISMIPTTVPDVRYPALSVGQALACTLCSNCKRKFKYAIEYLFHFTFKKTCLRVVLKRRSDKSQFFEKLNQTIQSKVQVPVSSLCCLKTVGSGTETRVCGFRSASVLQYCMHSDKHVPDSGELFACCLCTGLFFTPFSIYRHKCFVRLELNSGKLFRPNQLFSVYAAVPAKTLAILLTCPSCGKKYDYISGLLNHLKKSNSRCLASLSSNYTKFLTPERNLSLGKMFLAKFGLAEVPTQCEVCQETLISELAYCMHKDHHSVAGDAKFVCKGCQADCTSPCAFYRHTCSSPEVPWCPLCERATAHEKQTLKVEEILVEDDDADIEETTSETSASAGEDDITFLDMLETQRASTVEIEDEVSIIFEDNSTSPEMSPNVKPTLKRIGSNVTLGHKRHKLHMEAETSKTTTTPEAGTSFRKSTGLGAESSPSSSSATSSIRGSDASIRESDGEGVWLKDWLGLPSRVESKSSSELECSTNLAADQTNVSADEDLESGPEMEGSGLTPKQRAHAKEKERRRNEDDQIVKTKQGKLPKGYVLEKINAEDSKVTRQCLDQMFDDDSDPEDAPKLEAVQDGGKSLQSHSIGCVQIDQDVLREINNSTTLGKVKVEPGLIDDDATDIQNSQDDMILCPITGTTKLADAETQSKKMCIYDTRTIATDRDTEKEKKNLSDTESSRASPTELIEGDLKKVGHEVGKGKPVMLGITLNGPIEDISSPVLSGDEEGSFWAQYYCTTCHWLLGGAEGLVQHNREQRGRHHNVKPLWSFNQQEVRLQDLKKSRKFGVMVRELEREYQREQLTKEEESPEKEQDKELQSKEKEEEDIKLKISKASNGRFSVVN